MEKCLPCHRTANWDGAERLLLDKSPAKKLPGDYYLPPFNPEESKNGPISRLLTYKTQYLSLGVLFLESITGSGPVFC